MARVEGIVRFKGSLGGISFYKSKDGYVARSKGGPDKKKISNDPAFERTRENTTEFGKCVKCASIIKQVTVSLNKNSKDHRMTSRLNAVMFALKELDNINPRGQRAVATGIATLAGKELLKGFEFNKNARLNSVLKKPYTLNTNNGAVQINNLKTDEDIVFPQGATHVCLTSGWARINFVTGEKEFAVSNTTYLARGAAQQTVTLTPNALLPINGTDIFVLQLRFVQEIGGVQYELHNGEHNCMRITGVS